MGSLGFGLLCVLSISAIPLLLVLGDAGGSPLVFQSRVRLPAALLNLLAFLLFAAPRLGLPGALRLFREMVRLSPCWSFLLVLLATVDGVFYAFSTRWINPSLSVVLFESWPALLALALSALPATRAYYRADLRLLLQGMALVYLGVVVVMAGYAGGMRVLFGGGGLEVLLGGSLAFLGSLLTVVAMASSVLWVRRVERRLSPELCSRLGHPGVVLCSVFFLMVLSSSPWALLSLSLRSSLLVSPAVLSYGFFLFLGGLSAWMVNVVGRSLVANAVIYLGAPLGVLWPLPLGSS